MYIHVSCHHNKTSKLYKKVMRDLKVGGGVCFQTPLTNFNNRRNPPPPNPTMKTFLDSRMKVFFFFNTHFQVLNITRRIKFCIRIWNQILQQQNSLLFDTQLLCFRLDDTKYQMNNNQWIYFFTKVSDNKI